MTVKPATSGEGLRVVARKYGGFKSALTRAQNRRDWEAVIRVVDTATAWFDEHNLPTPDNFALFTNARDRAVLGLLVDARSLDKIIAVAGRLR